MVITPPKAQRGPFIPKPIPQDRKDRVGQEYVTMGVFNDSEILNLVERSIKDENNRNNFSFRKLTEAGEKATKGAEALSKIWGKSFQKLISDMLPNYGNGGIFTEFLKEYFEEFKIWKPYVNLYNSYKVLQPFIGDLKTSHLKDYELKQLNDEVLEFEEVERNFPDQSLPSLEKRYQVARSTREAIKRIGDTYRDKMATSHQLSKMYFHFDKIVKDLEDAVNFSQERKRIKDREDSLTSDWDSQEKTIREYKDKHDIAGSTEQAKIRDQQKVFVESLKSKYDQIRTNTESRLKFLHNEMVRKLSHAVSSTEEADINTAYNKSITEIIKKLSTRWSILQHFKTPPTDDTPIEFDYIDSKGVTTRAHYSVKHDPTLVTSKQLIP